MYNGYGGSDSGYGSGFHNGISGTANGYPTSPSLGGCPSSAGGYQYGAASGGTSPSGATAASSPLLMGCYAPRVPASSASLMLGLSGQEKTNTDP